MLRLVEVVLIFSQQAEWHSDSGWGQETGSAGTGPWRPGSGLRKPASVYKKVRLSCVCSAAVIQSWVIIYLKLEISSATWVRTRGQRLSQGSEDIQFSPSVQTSLCSKEIISIWVKPGEQLGIICMKVTRDRRGPTAWLHHHRAPQLGWDRVFLASSRVWWSFLNQIEVSRVSPKQEAAF